MLSVDLAEHAVTFSIRRQILLKFGDLIAIRRHIAGVEFG